MVSGIIGSGYSVIIGAVFTASWRLFNNKWLWLWRLKMNELNRKLAEWAGFTKKLVWSDPADIVPRHQFEVWVEPSGRVLGVARPTPIPNFTESLDACFKWLIPNLYAYCLRSFHQGHKNHHASIVPYPYTSLDNMVVFEATIAREESLALALCLAIEKLIGG